MNPPPSASPPTSQPPSVDLLILGAGWTFHFLSPLLEAHGISFAATTRTGRDSTIRFAFDPAHPDAEAFGALPGARTVLITFPITAAGGARTLVELYGSTHGAPGARFVLLGSTGAWPKSAPAGPVSRHDPIDPGSARGAQEERLLELGGVVLNLAGLWGHGRQPRRFLERVAPSKDALAGKATLHLVHGEDVARAIVAVHENWEKAREERGGGCAAAGKGQGSTRGRWIVADCRSYDWWLLAMAWGKGEWVLELMEERGVGALPRWEGTGQAVEGMRRLVAWEFWARVVGAPPRRGLEVGS